MQFRILALMLCGFLLSACQQSQAENETAKPIVAPKPLVEPIDPVKSPSSAVKARKQQMAIDVDLETMRSEILALIGEPLADNVQQCRIVGLGSKPCGGPASYIAFSTKDKNEVVITSLIDKYNAAMKSENARLGLISNCAVVPKPAVVLENGVCTLKKAPEGDIF